MSKFLNIRALISLLAVICLITVLFFILRSCGQERAVNASVSSTDILLGDRITYADSTSGAEDWLWEFGNGYYSTERKGDYQFPETGRYQIRLKVNQKQEKIFLVRVRERPENYRTEHLIRINAPETAMQGEYILFSAGGNDEEWRWEFGESGIVDSREKTPIYAYQNQGVYLVKLHTEKTQYPILHRIEVFPKYMENDSTDMMTIAGNDIKMKLQNIADGKSFNSNYNHILKTYLCGNSDMLVTINNTRRNDFYSYCQGLRLTGKGTTIETVFVESAHPEGNCIDHIIVLQYAPGEAVSTGNLLSK